MSTGHYSIMFFLFNASQPYKLHVSKMWLYIAILIEWVCEKKINIPALYSCERHYVYININYTITRGIEYFSVIIHTKVLN